MRLPGKNSGLSKQKNLRLLYFQDKVVQLSIIRQRRKTLAIHVFPGDKPVEFRVPMKCPWREIDGFLASRTSWIFESMQELAKEPPPPTVTYTSGELHFFLGEAHALQLQQGRGTVERVNARLKVRCQDPRDQSMVRAQLEKFYKKESLPVFESRLDLCVKRFPVAVEPAGLRVRKMKARWGSCTKSGELCLNTLLVQNSVRVIDFVIMHELCHLRHFSHNRAFYELLDRAMADWRESEEALGKNLAHPCQFQLF